MKRTLAYLLAFVPLLVLTVPGTASAAFWGPIVDGRCLCPGSAPDYGCVIQTIQNTMNLGVSLAVVIATLVIAYAGAIWLVSPVNPKSREMGRTMLLNAVIGLVVLLAGWIFVDFLMKQLYNESANSNGVQLGPWNEILAPSATGDDMCIERRTEFGQNTPSTPSTGGTGTVTTPGDDDDDDDTPTPTPSPQSCTVTDSKSACGGFYIQTACGTSHNTNVKNLVDAGVRGQSTGSCCMKNNDSCTSLDGISSNAINLIRNLQEDYGGVLITGGTETGHTNHGYNRSFDMGISAAGDAAIRALPRATAEQRDCHDILSTNVYASTGSGASYFDEGGHWHVTVGGFSSCLPD